ncbi:MAG: phosphoribosylanthranilate isomerase [Rhodospirillaceae bacterium]|jgi:phosphoribosylanthranilate isomerase
MSLTVKICGLKTVDAVRASVENGAAYVGFVFFEKSPRHVTPFDAQVLSGHVPQHVTKTGLLVDATDDEIEVILGTVPLNLLQLHGSETPARVSAIKEKFQLPVMKAIAVADEGDVKSAKDYEGPADRLLFDAKPPKGADRPGGHGAPLPWGLLAGQSFETPWMLAGGLTPENLAEAVTQSGAAAVDVSSGVEDTPGFKSPNKIKEFLAIAAGL